MREVSPRSPVAILLILFVLAYAILLVGAPIAAIVDGTFSGETRPTRGGTRTPVAEVDPNQSEFERRVNPVWEALDNPQVLHALQLTFMLAAGATLLNTVFGMMIAWVLERQRFIGRRMLDLLVDIPFVFSPVIAGYTLIVLFGRGGWIDSPVAIVFALPGMLLAKTFVCLPFVPREVGPVLSNLTQEPEEAAYTLGASRWGTFWRIVLPNIWIGLIYGIVLTLARGLGEFGAVAVVSGGIEGKTETATMFVFRALSDRNRIGAYSVSLALGAIAVLILVVMSFLHHRLNVNRERSSHVYSVE